jgi:thioredoxin reductase
MPELVRPLIESRRDQMFPVLEQGEIGQLARFGERKSYLAGERIFATGQIPPGALIILKGRVDVTQRGLEHLEPIVTHGPGSFMGELAQLSGSPSLVDAVAVEAAETLVIPPRRLRDLLVEEAELGERIMRAMAIPDEAGGLEAQTALDGGRFLLTLANQERVRARAVVVATGAQYRRLEVANLAPFEGSSVHYWASPLEGRLCAGQEVALVGAGNSAGQAAVYLASHAAKVWLIVRGHILDTSMSRYLVDRIAAISNIEVMTQTAVAALEGQGGILEAVRCRSHRSGAEVKRAIRHLFLFIGAEPHTRWLTGSGVTLDDKGFVRTGANVKKPLETRLPGVFAIGDVRSGSVKRVAAAVGEGAQVVAALHAFLAEAGDKPALSVSSGSA